MKTIILGVLDLICAILSIFSAFMAKIQTRFGSDRLPLSYKIWDKFGVTPMSHHYYSPVFDIHNLPDATWNAKDPLCGIDFNEDAQLSLLAQFTYQDELSEVDIHKSNNDLGFYHQNNSFENADAEMLYNMVRFHKPRRVIEIGCGYSTRMLKRALDQNKQEGTPSTHICIEPYEMPWLEQLGIDSVIRKKVEDVEAHIFDQLEAGDILFIDSSHVLRVSGDVFVEYLRILPSLKVGVIVHIHDIFLPYEYPKSWIVDERRFWTEQYVLQAFLVYNPKFEILSAVHWLSREHSELLAKVCPVYGQLGGAPGSFWIRKTN